MPDPVGSRPKPRLRPSPISSCSRVSLHASTAATATVTTIRRRGEYLCQSPITNHRPSCCCLSASCNPTIRRRAPLLAPTSQTLKRPDASGSSRQHTYQPPSTNHQPLLSRYPPTTRCRHHQAERSLTRTPSLTRNKALPIARVTRRQSPSSTDPPFLFPSGLHRQQRTRPDRINHELPTPDPGEPRRLEMCLGSR